MGGCVAAPPGLSYARRINSYKKAGTRAAAFREAALRAGAVPRPDLDKLLH